MIHHASHIIHHAWYIIHHTSYTSYIIHHASHIMHHTSYTSYIIHHTSYIMHHTSYIIQHTAYNIHHTSYIIHHTSYAVLCNILHDAHATTITNSLLQVVKKLKKGRPDSEERSEELKKEFMTAVKDAIKGLCALTLKKGERTMGLAVWVSFVVYAWCSR